MKRFYTKADVEPADGGWRVLLDGRPIRTAGARPQIVPTQAMAQALAAEWAAQGERIDPATFRYRDLSDFAIDAVAPDREAIVVGLLPYAETDTLCYRADPDEALYQRQLEIWEPLLRHAESRFGISLPRISGVMHKPLPAQALARLKAELDSASDFELAALKMLASLSASLVIAIEAIRPDADADRLWQAAELEADWQAGLWGEDWEAAERRAARFEAFELAMRLARLAR